VIAPRTLIEDWSDYDISDGTRLRAKLVVFKILGQPAGTSESPILNLAGNLQLVVVPPDHLKGHPEALTPAQISSAPKTPVIPTPRREPWSYYLLPGQPEERMFMKIRVTVIAAHRVVDHFDGEGNPLYSLSTGMIGGPTSRSEADAAWRALLEDPFPPER
jgi:hypothetical protein